MATLALYLLVLIAGMVSLAGLPSVVAIPLTVVLGVFALIVITQMWRTYQVLAAARTISVKPPAVKSPPAPARA